MGEGGNKLCDMSAAALKSLLCERSVVGWKTPFDVTGTVGEKLCDVSGSGRNTLGEVSAVSGDTSGDLTTAGENTLCEMSDTDGNRLSVETMMGKA